VEGERDLLQNIIEELETQHQQQLKELEEKASANLREKVEQVESAKNELVSRVASLQESLRVNTEALESVKVQLEDVVRKGVEKEEKVKKLESIVKTFFLPGSQAVVKYFQEIVNPPDNDVGDDNGEEMEACGNSTLMEDSTPTTSTGPRRPVSLPARGPSTRSRPRNPGEYNVLHGGVARPFRCGICDKSFTSERYLKTHTTVMHNDW